MAASFLCECVETMLRHTPTIKIVGVYFDEAAGCPSLAPLSNGVVPHPFKYFYAG